MACAEPLHLEPVRRSFRTPRTLPQRHRAGAALQRAWRSYWRRRAVRATLQILHALDDRTLKDIGIDRSEIESVVCSAPGERLVGLDTAAAATGSHPPERPFGLCA